MMASEDKLTRSNSRSDKFAGSLVKPAPAPSVSPEQAASPSQTPNIKDEIFRAIVDQAVVGFVQSDVAGRITFVNDRYCEITGYMREELLGKRWLELTHPDDLPQNIEYIKRMKHNEKPASFEKRYLRKNGEIIWVNIGASQQRHADGQEFGGAAFVVDITARKFAETKNFIAKSELEATLAAIPDLIFELGLDGRYLNVHASRPELLAAPAEVLIGKTVRDSLPPDAADEVMLALREAHETGRSYGRQIKLHVPHGISWFELSIARKVVPEGQEPSFIVLSHDFTERKQTSELLRKSAEEIEDLYNNAPCGYHSLDHNGIICKINDTELAWLGYTRGEVVGRMLWTGMITPASQQAFRKDFPRFKDQGFVRDFQIELIRRDGTVFDGLINASAIYDPSGEFLMSRSTLLDITGRRNTEDLLRFHSEILGNLSEGVFLVRPDNGVIVFTNPQFDRIMGYGPDELVGKHVSIINAPGEKDPETVANEINDALINKGMWGGEVHNIRKDGTHIWCQTSASVFDHPKFGKVGISVHQDITEQKNLESALQERRNEMAELQKLQIAAQTAAAFAHELNQPLLAIASYSEAALILLRANNPNLDKARIAIEGSERQAHRAGQAIRKMLEFLSLKEFPTDAFDLNKEIVATLELARLEYELQFDSVLRLENALPMVQANRTHIQKVLLNLLHNCIEAMQESGVLPPSIIVTICTLKEESLVQMTIRDNGPGFKKEDIQHLFVPFYTTKARGIGMGLAISRALVEANGGQLWVDPQEGPGATFLLTLPLAT